jgi:hypothetical protein
MAGVRDALKTFVITDEVRKNLTPEELADLEALINSAQTGAAGVTLHNPDKFDAKDMQPAGKGPVNWKKPRR